MKIPVRIDVQVDNNAVNLNMQEAGGVKVYDVEPSEVIVAGLSEPYEGEYVFTPTEDEQIIPINGKKAIQDITINPIPSNYGLITWDGTIITVS